MAASRQRHAAQGDGAIPQHELSARDHAAALCGTRHDARGDRGPDAA